MDLVRKGPFKSNVKKYVAFLWQNSWILYKNQNLPIFTPTLQRSGHHSQQTRMQVWTFWWEIGQEPMVHSRFLPPKVASSTTQAMPNRRRFLSYWMFRDFSPSKPFTGHYFQIYQTKKSIMPFAMLPSYWMCGCTCTCICIYVYIINIYIYQYTQTEYTWYAPPVTVTTTIKPYIFRRLQKSRINPLVVHYQFQSNPWVLSWGGILCIIELPCCFR